MLAFLQNGELLHPDHGYPVRLLIPGYIGGRMIKWLCKITVSSKETDNFYHVQDWDADEWEFITKNDELIIYFINIQHFDELFGQFSTQILKNYGHEKSG